MSEKTVPSEQEPRRATEEQPSEPTVPPEQEPTETTDDANSEVTVPFNDKASDTAVLLLAAAEELDLDPSTIRTVEGAFVVPKNVHERAFPPKSGRKKKSESEEG